MRNPVLGDTAEKGSRFGLVFLYSVKPFLPQRLLAMNLIKRSGMEVQFIIFLMTRWWSKVSITLFKSSTAVTILSDGFFLLNPIEMILIRVWRTVAVECPDQKQCRCHA